MAISDEARRNHEALFPNHESTLASTDLELVELFDNWTFDEVGGCEPQLAGHVAGNVAVGNDRAVLVSTNTQLLPFIGYPRTLSALRVINEGTSA